jgi:hypothetical protein
MKTRALVVIVSVIAAVVLGGYLIDKYVQRGIEAGMALERAKAAEAQVATLELEISAKNAVISSRDGELEASRQAAKERERWFLAQLSNVQVATPTQLVDQGSEILGVDDITTNGETVSMSVETYRKIVFRLVEHQEYVNVREPAWNAREALYQVQISDLKSVVAAHEQKDILNAGIISDLKTVISHNKNMSFLEKAAWTAGGFAVGVVAGKI